MARPFLLHLGPRLLALALASTAVGCAATLPRVEGHGDQLGVASYYGRDHHGRRTASGERFDMNEMTAAHRTLPFGTRVRVTNLKNGRQALLRINDRGPFERHRILDVSYAAARRLGFAARGIARVRIEIL